MRYVIKIMKYIGIYLIVFILSNAFFSWIYYEMGVSYPYSQILMYSISDNLKFLEGIDNNGIFILQAIQNMCQLICATVMTGFILNCIIHKMPNFLWPYRLVIRRNKKNKLKLGVMIGNKSKKVIHEATCTIWFSYIDEVENERDASCKIRQDTTVIENYNRFSFDLNEVPLQILEAFLRNEPDLTNKYLINVYVRGRVPGLSKSFLLCRQYTLNDICIITKDPDFKENKTIGNTTRKRILWDAVQMKTIPPVNDEIEAQIKNEIRDIILQQNE